ncbi:MAG: hypothetical protein IID63_08880 [candidate division Zixibacteria bacterium]|nr:hypothetical protein [candidate division Zixibacteria bacterium]
MKKRDKFSQLIIATALLLLLLSILSGCAARRTITPDMPYWKDADRKDIPEPEGRDPGLAWTSIKRSAFDQVRQGINVERNFRIILSNRIESHNINSFDEVPNSTWFTNRHGLFELSPEEIFQGPVIGDGPDTAAAWEVFRPKVGGATPGFWIKDSRGDQYIIKFDPKGYPEMSTAAAAMASRYFHACGYNVPEETIVYWRPEKLKIKPGATIKDDGVKREFTRADLDKILSDVEREENGTIRSLASKIIEGKIKGPFSFSGKRRDDPNDWCNHQNRRELRALYVFASFVNHYDTKDQNTLDTYIEEDGRHFLKHYLIDFGSTFGADGDGPKPAIKGYANFVDLRDMLVSTLTLGLKTWPWEGGGGVEHRSIGYFESQIFQANKFDPIVPNPAFEEMTYADAFWAAKIIMSFDEEDLRALVRAGKYSDSQAEKYLLKTLLERQQKIGRHWFSKVNPLDEFDFDNSDGAILIDFEDLAVRHGFELEDETHYKYSVKYQRLQKLESAEFGGSQFVISPKDVKILAASYRAATNENSDSHLYEILISTKRGDSYWSKHTALWLWYHPDKNSFQLVGIEHRS